MSASRHEAQPGCPLPAIYRKEAPALRNIRSPAAPSKRTGGLRPVFVTSPLSTHLAKKWGDVWLEPPPGGCRREISGYGRHGDLRDRHCRRTLDLFCP